MDKIIETISLEKAKALIEEAHAVVCNDFNAGLCYPSVWELTSKDDSEWLFCEYDTPNGHSVNHVFNEESQEIKFDGTSIYMKNIDGTVVELILLVPMTKHRNN